MFSVNYASLNSDSPFVAAVTDGDLVAGDRVYYDRTSSGGKKVHIDPDGLVTIYDQTLDDSFSYWIEDASNGFTKVGPATITLNGPN